MYSVYLEMGRIAETVNENNVPAPDIYWMLEFLLRYYIVITTNLYHHQSYNILPITLI